MDRRQAIADDLRALADDLKSLVDSATTDPKERRRKERQWSILQSVVSITVTLAARRVAIRLWGILTGEEAPVPRPVPPQPDEREAETIASSSSSVK